MINVLVNSAKWVGVFTFYNSATGQDFSKWCSLFHSYPVGNYMFKVSNRNTRRRCEICSELTIKTP